MSTAANQSCAASQRKSFITWRALKREQYTTKTELLTKNGQTLRLLPTTSMSHMSTNHLSKQLKPQKI